MYFLKIYDNSTEKIWEEQFYSYYLFSKRVTKLKHSKKLIIVSRSGLENENNY